MEPLKIEKINSLFTCTFCNEVFQTPVLLPCGETICQKDLIELQLEASSSTINCCFCYKQHHRPLEGFPVVKRIVDLIELGNDRINFGKTFEYGKNLLKDIDKTIKEFEFIHNDPSYYIYTCLQGLKNQCDIRRENLKLEIDNHFDMLLCEIEKFNIECESVMRKSESLSNKLEGYRASLNEWKKSYDTVNLQEEIRDQVILKAKLTKLKLDIELNALKQNLLQNKTPNIDFDQEIDPRLFGSIKFQEVFNLIYVYFQNFIKLKCFN